MKHKPGDVRYSLEYTPLENVHWLDEGKTEYDPDQTQNKHLYFSTLSQAEGVAQNLLREKKDFFGYIIIYKQEYLKLENMSKEMKRDVFTWFNVEQYGAFDPDLPVSRNKEF
ncbi:MAG: hypothetical protein WDA09_06140 [Bacteriovoracaceae bacterium]